MAEPVRFPAPPLKMNLGDKLQRLAILNPKDLRALEIVVDDLLERRWPTYPPRRRTDAA